LGKKGDGEGGPRCLSWIRKEKYELGAIKVGEKLERKTGWCLPFCDAKITATICVSTKYK